MWEKIERIGEYNELFYQVKTIPISRGNLLDSDIHSYYYPDRKMKTGT